MARFKNKDLHILQGEEVLFGDAQEASIQYDGSNLLVNRLLEHTVDGPYATREWVDQTVAGLEWQDAVLSKTTDIPAGTEGDRYIIPSGASGAWSGLDDSIAEYTTTWVYTTPSAGFSAYVDDENTYYVYNGTNWIRFGGIVDHGVLQGLADDDHTQYLLADGSRAADNLTVTGTVTAAEFQAWQGAEDDEAILFRSTDVAHGITTIAETNVYGHLAKADADAGGVGLWGFSESTIGSSIYSYYGGATGDTDKNTTALGAITLYALQADGTGVQDVGATDNILVLRPRRSGALSSSLIADGSGNLYVDGDYRSFGTTLSVLTSNNYGMAIAADGTITFSGSVSGEDHGLLTGLADDDHIQYYHTDGRRSWSGALTVESAESKITFLEDTATIGVSANPDLMTLSPTAVVFDGDIYCNTLYSASASVIIGGVTLSDVDGVLTVDSIISSPSGSGGSDYATIQYVDTELVTKSDTGHDHGDIYYTETEVDTNFAPIGEGVTSGDGHAHTGGEGAQIDHTGLANKGTNTHATIDTFITNLNSHNNTYHSATYITATGVTYENLDSAGDVGTSAGQVSIGDHTHPGLGGWTYGSQVATNTGTTRVLTTAIPTSATEIDIMFNGVSTNTTAQPPIVQLGDAGGYETTGYTAGAVGDSGDGSSTVTSSQGFITWAVGGGRAWVTADAIEGIMRLARWDTSEFLWFAAGGCASDAGVDDCFSFAGGKATSQVTTSVRLNTPGGSATFDGGEARVRWR